MGARWLASPAKLTAQITWFGPRCEQQYYAYKSSFFSVALGPTWSLQANAGTSAAPTCSHRYTRLGDAPSLSQNSDSSCATSSPHSPACATTRMVYTARATCSGTRATQQAPRRLITRYNVCKLYGNLRV
jgi:hypothetical protein